MVPLYVYSNFIYYNTSKPSGLSKEKNAFQGLNIMLNFYLRLNDVRNIILLVYIWQLYISDDGLHLIYFITYLYAISSLILFKFTLKIDWKINWNVCLRLIQLINWIKYAFYLSIFYLSFFQFIFVIILKEFSFFANYNII